MASNNWALRAAICVFLAGCWRAGRLLAQTLAGGTFSIPSSFFAAAGGGTPVTGANMVLTHSIGQTGNTQMSGGTLQLVPGVLGAQSAAAPTLNAVHAFPNPFKPVLGHDRITFRGLTADATIRVYTLSGELVQTLSKSDPATQDLVWYPVSNSAGQSLASGVYLYAIQGDTGKAAGKLMIIK